MRSASRIGFGGPGWFRALASPEKPEKTLRLVGSDVGANSARQKRVLREEQGVRCSEEEDLGPRECVPSSVTRLMRQPVGN